ncbi:MAG: tRNA (adenosine(37)-N6)-threonylcarbamoyltransferase complex transferase subunit TsaD [Patescibacteria group bacterium]
MKKLILGIETSCDETALALVEGSGSVTRPTFKIKKALVHSQILVHHPFGGVVPNLAKREHLINLPILLSKIDPKGTMMQEVDAIAVTVGPGLEPALWTGIEFAKTLAKASKKPLIGANHLEGHLYSFILDWQKKKASSIFPAIALIASGAHTILLKMDSLMKWKNLGETRDDAVGEAFDKVGRLLGLPYPGGPEIEKLAVKGNCMAINFPQPMKYDKNYEFSYSGLKTSVLYYLRDLSPNPHTLSPKIRADVAASFERAATDVLVHKANRAIKEFGAKSIVLCGGVAANKQLRKKLSGLAKQHKIQLFVPEFKHNTDNAVMIAVAGYMTLLRKSAKGGSASGGKKYPIRANGNMGI